MLVVDLLSGLFLAVGDWWHWRALCCVFEREWTVAFDCAAVWVFAWSLDSMVGAGNHIV